MPIKKYIDKAAELSILAIVLVLPVIFYTRANDVFEINKMFSLRFFTVLIAALWLIRAAAEKKAELIKTAFDFPLLGFLGVSIVTTFITANFLVSVYGVYEDYEGILTILNYFALFYIIVNFARRFDTVYKILLVIAAATFITAGYGLAQNLGWDFVRWNPETYSPDRFFATLGNPNFLAAYLVEAIPILFVLFLVAGRVKLPAAVFFMSVPVMLLSWYASIGRGFNPALVFLITLVFAGALRGTGGAFPRVKKFLENNGSKIFILFILFIAITAQFLTKSRAGFASQIVTFYFLGMTAAVFFSVRLVRFIREKGIWPGVSKFLGGKKMPHIASAVILAGVIIFFFPVISGVIRSAAAKGALALTGGFIAVAVVLAVVYAAVYFSVIIAINMAGGSFDSISDNRILGGNKWWFAVFGIVVAGTLFIPMVRDAFAMLWERSRGLFSFQGVILTPRLYIWKSAIMMFKDHFLLGTGLDTFQVMFPYYRYPIYWQLEWNGTPEKTHNIYLQVLATQGIAGFSFYALIIATFFKKTYNIMKSELDRERKYLVFGLFLAVVAYFIQGMFNYTVVAYGAVFWMGLAMISLLDSSKREYYRYHIKRRVPVLPAALIIGVAALVLQVFLVRFWMADMYFKIGNIAVANNKPEISIGYYQNAVKYNPFREIYYVKYGIGYERAMRRQTDLQKKQAYAGSAINIHEKTIKMNSKNGYNYNNLARVYKFYGEMTQGKQPAVSNANYGKAIQFYNEAIERDPNNAYFGLDLATVYINKGNYEKALELCGHYNKMYPKFATPLSYMGYIYMLRGKEKMSRAVYYYEEAVDGKYWHGDRTTEASTYSNLAILYVNMGKRKKAIEMFSKVVEIRPKYIEAYLNLGRLYAMTGDYEKARDIYEKALKINPGDRRVRSALEQIRGKVKK